MRKDILDEVVSAAGYLRTVEEVLRTEEEQLENTGLRNSLARALDLFKGCLERLLSQPAPRSGLMKAARSLVWSLKASEVNEILDTLSRQKSTFVLILQKLQGDTVRDTYTEVQCMKDDIQTLAHRSHSDEEQRMLDWLTPVTPEQIHSDICERRLDGTGGWLLEHANYINWRDKLDSDSILGPWNSRSWKDLSLIARPRRSFATRLHQKHWRRWVLLRLQRP